MDITPNTAEPSARPFQYSLRALLMAVTVIGLFLGITTALVRSGQALIMKIERDAARERVLSTGSESKYDRRLLGAEVYSLKAQHRQQVAEQADGH